MGYMAGFTLYRDSWYMRIYMWYQYFEYDIELKTIQVRILSIAQSKLGISIVSAENNYMWKQCITYGLSILIAQLNLPTVTQ